MECKKCKSKKINKAGKINTKQRYKCKDCGYQFTENSKKIYSETIKLTACLLYIKGLSFRTIAKLFNASPNTIMTWIRKFALENYEKPQVQNKEITIELDEMWHFINSKKINSGYGKHIAEILKSLSTGNVEVVTIEHF